MREKPYVLIELPADFMTRMHLLGSMDTTVQSRHEKGPVNRKDQAEIHTIVNALKLGLNLPIPLPACVIHSDRPDVVIKSAKASIGIEIVEAVSETTAAMDHERAKLSNAAEFHWARKQVPGEIQKTAREVRELVFNNDPGDGFIGDGAVEWAEAIAHFVQRKMEIVSKPGFQRFEQNWLLVYDNWREPTRNPKEASIVLQRMLNDMTAFCTFDLVMVLDDECLCVFEAEQT
ncbi:hypothetical protein [Pseudomonas sp. DSP3-2-2]|uniref:hypothetical protein n=1 Tax=unclassified Pseudomonas TaxID=196821 RepID=UPI003CF430AB